MQQSYQEFTKYQGSVVDNNVGFLSGSELPTRRIRRSLPLTLGDFYQTCPILKLRDDSTTMYMLESGTVEINLNFYIDLRDRDRDRDLIIHRADIILDLYHNENRIRRIRENLVGLGIHRISLLEYIPIIQYDTLRFTLRAYTRDAEAFYYNVEEDVYTTGTVRLL